LHFAPHSKKCRGKQEEVAYNDHLPRTVSSRFFAFPERLSEGKTKIGERPCRDGTPPFISPLLEHYRPWSQVFWVRADAAFANPASYEYCEEQRMIYFRQIITWIGWWRLI
jgi:hypothetical protein